MSGSRRGTPDIDIAGYSISGEIGRGGMAVVYRARQVLLDREVALKVLNPQLAQDPVNAQRFLQEARMLASLGHPHIVPVYDVGVTPQGLHYFSMQMIRQGDFARRLRDGIDEVELVRVLIAVAQALGFAHARGYVHRDVTPANILFDDQNVPILTDFGIARALAATSRMTASGLSIGTSHYMSPEQARGGEVDRRSDIYSLGVLCFEALSGKPPYDGEDGFAVAYAHVHEPIPRLPDDLAKWQPLIDRCMAKVPDQRYSDCAQFIEGLRGIATAEFDTLMTTHGPAALGMMQTPLPENRGKPARGRKAKAEPVPVAKPLAAVPGLAPGALAKPARAAGAPSRFPLYVIGAVIGLGVVLAGIGLFRSGDASAPAATVAATRAPATSSPVSRTPPGAPAAGTDAGTLGASSSMAADADGVPTEFALVADFDPATQPTVIDPVVELLARGRTNMAAQRYSTPPGNNALDRYALALVIEPGNADAIAGITAVAQVYLDQLAATDADAQPQAWDEQFAVADRIARTHKLAPVLSQLQALRKAETTRLLARGNAAILAWDTATAQSAFERMAVLVPDSKDAARGLRDAARVGKPGYVFRDALGKEQGPELVVMAGLALGRREVTVGEFRRYWDAAGKKAFGAAPPSCRDRESIFRSSRKRTWSDPGFKQGDNHPVVCVSAAMADGYAAWLSERTGKTYRLPSAAEMGKAGLAPAKECRGNVMDADFRKEFGGRAGFTCGDGHAWTAPAGAFAADNAGLYDTSGNVREWTRDCDAGNCRERQAAGASWFSDADDKPVRTFAADTAFNTIGLRVSRKID